MDAIKIIQDAQKTVWTVSGVSYQDVLKLQKKLDKAKIRCNISVGGFSIYPRRKSGIVRMLRICKKAGMTPYKGISRHKSDVILGVRK